MGWKHWQEAYALIHQFKDERCDDKRRLPEIVGPEYRVPLVGWRDPDGSWVECDGGDGPYIYKPLYGEMGQGVAVCNSREECPPGNVLTLQVVQHQKLRRIWNGSVASLRVLVLDGTVLDTLWMFGVNPNSYASNDMTGCLWAHVDGGGAIDGASVRVRPRDKTKRKAVHAHPVSRVPVLGLWFDLMTPHMVSCRLSDEAGLRLTGWDWALTEDAEWRVMEVNSTPSIAIHDRFRHDVWPIVEAALTAPP